MKNTQTNKEKNNPPKKESKIGFKFELKNKKPLVFLLMMMCVCGFSATIAYYYTSYVFANEFITAEQNIVLEESFPVKEWDTNDTLIKKAVIKNKGNIPVFLRVSYNELWYRLENDDKKIYNNLYNGSEIVTKTWNEDFLNNFTENDGWYYYNKVLEPEGVVNILDSITKVQDVYNETNMQYELDFNFEVVQIENNASSSVWGLTPMIADGIVTWNFN